jgi:hypothetical protein
VHVAVAPDRGGAVSFSMAADDAGVSLSFKPSFGLVLRYTMAPVATQISGLQAFASNDTLSIGLSGSDPSTARLYEDPDGSSPTALALVGSQTGKLLRVGSGMLSLTSTFAPDASVTVAPSQCLVRTPGQPGVHEVLKDLSVTSCP